jgi:low density lipoprotein-related protein 2
LHLDFHYEKEWIYWVDFNNFQWNGIYRIRPNGTELQPVVTENIGTNGIRGLAIDWVAGNMYFTNVYPHETQIEVCWLDGSFRLVLKSSTTEAPRQIAVNPVKRYIYWIDYGQYPSIGRANLDGSESQSLISSGVTEPRDLVIDINTHDVYWIDSREDVIHKMSFSGGNRDIVRRNIPSGMGLAVLGSDIYWVDRNLETIFKSSKIPGNNSAPVVVRSELPKLRDIAIYDAINQPRDESTCTRLGNGGCQQLCFAFPPTAARTGSKKTYECRCAVGVLQPDGSCDHPNEYLVFTTRTELRTVFLDPSDPSSPVPTIGNLTNVVGVDFDYANSRLFFTQIRPKRRIAWLSTKNPKAGITDILTEGINPEGVAYDWTSGKIYWTDSANSSIYSMNVDGSHIVSIVEVDRPRAIILDPCNG